jgi:hypothetical protein
MNCVGHESEVYTTRGWVRDQGGSLSYILKHPAREIGERVRAVLKELGQSLGKLYASEGVRRSARSNCRAPHCCGCSPRSVRSARGFRSNRIAYNLIRIPKLIAVEVEVRHDSRQTPAMTNCEKRRQNS